MVHVSFCNEKIEHFFSKNKNFFIWKKSHFFTYQLRFWLEITGKCMQDSRKRFFLTLYLLHLDGACFFYINKTQLGPLINR